jgi:hypothetical protein
MPLIQNAVQWDNSWVDNRDGTCWGQCLVWLKLRRSNKTRNGQDFTDGIEDVVRSNSAQRGVSYEGLCATCTSSDRKKYQGDSEFLDGITWSGKYKIIVIEGGGHKHAIALYTPWLGAYELLDPNQGVYKHRDWGHIKSVLLQFLGHDAGTSCYWFFREVVTVPESSL